jgi:hypothetical protein
MSGIFNRPMGTNSISNKKSIAGQARNVVAILSGDFTIDSALTLLWQDEKSTTTSFCTAKAIVGFS